MLAKTKTHVDKSTFTITFQRSLAATREEAFDAWTDPEQIKYWWDPTGVPLAACAIDLRVGGAFQLTMASQHAPPFAGTYRVLDRPGRIEFDALGSFGTVQLERGTGEATEMTVRIRCASAEHLDHFVKLGVADGTDQTLDNLVEYVARRA